MNWGKTLEAFQDCGFLYLRSEQAHAAASYALKLETLHLLTGVDRNSLDGYLKQLARSSVKHISQLMDEALRCAKTGDAAWIEYMEMMTQ